MANFYAYILVLALLTRCQEMTNKAKHKIRLINSIGNAQFLDFVNSTSSVPPPDEEDQIFIKQEGSPTFYKGDWHLGHQGDEDMVADT